MTETQKANRLIHSTSPYLLQHAFNPVDWHEWNDEALEKARREDKPVLVSIGYSSCHWCHVMEREVFEKDDIAAIMNANMVCIKVDREERPDVDQIYMEAVQAMGIHGGWPLNVFLTPDQKPFYGGTYFPPDQWVQVIQGIKNAFVSRRNEVEASATELTKALSEFDASRYKKEADTAQLSDDLDAIYRKLEPSFDKTWGGFDKEPKFIMPSVWRLLLRYYKITSNRECLDHVLFTLKKIGMGGIYDQAGGGFARYSVDKYWFVPHFEKMLYDNAQLLTLYAEAYAVSKDEQFRVIVDETFEWLQGEMMDAHGGFYSALDADSEGEEGKFYVWTAAELREVLGGDAALVMDYYSIKEDGNWEPQKNILMRVQQEDGFLKKHNLSADMWQQRLRKAKDALLAMRDKRIRPGLDDKIITSWNAMTIVGLVDAYKAFGGEAFLQAAVRTMQFIENELTEGLTLFRSYRKKRSAVKGFLDDYAYVIQAYISLYQATFNEYWILRARALAEHTMDDFYDPTDGFFHYAPKGGEKLIASRKEIFDNVIPSSTSVMAQNLFHLSIFFDHGGWREIAEKMTFPLGHLITGEPNYMSNWGIVYTEMKKGMAEVAFAGEGAKGAAQQIFATFNPFVLAMGTEHQSTLPLMEGKIAIDDRLTIYVCYNKTCQRPVHDVKEAMGEIV